MADELLNNESGLFASLLNRIVDEFAWMSDRSLESIARGGASSYISRPLACAIIEARQLGRDRRMSAA